MSPRNTAPKPQTPPPAPPPVPMPPRPPAPPPPPARSSVPTPQQAQPRPPNRPPVNQPPAPAQSFNSLFVPAAEVMTRLRIVFYGLPGSSKTPTALTAPRPGVIDVESLARIYARQFPNARFMPANSLAAVKEGIKSVIADGGHSLETLIVDSLTPIYNERKMFYLEKHGYLDRPQYARINTEMNEVYRLLAECPVHTIVIGREANLYEETEVKNYKTGKMETQLKLIGSKIDLDKSSGYQPNILIHMTGNNSGIIQKVQGIPPGYVIQGVEVKYGAVIPSLKWADFFQPIADMLSTGDDPQDITAGQGKALFLAYWNGAGLKNSQIVEALGIKQAADWKDGRSAADERITEYARSKGWLPDESEQAEPDGEQDQAPAAGSPFGSNAAGGYTDFEKNLIRALSPSPYKSDIEVMDAYTQLVNTGNIPPDWDMQQIVDYMFMVA